MENILESILLIILCGIINRYRGDKKDIISRTFEKILLAVTVGYLAGFAIDKSMLGFVTGFAVGVSFGWGTPISGYLNDRMMMGGYEWWQFGYLRKNALAALWFRGALWSACVAYPCITADIWSPIVATAVSFPLSLMLAKWLINNGYNRLGERFGWQQKSAWNTAEGICGLLLGSFSFLLPF